MPGVCEKQRRRKDAAALCHQAFSRGISVKHRKDPGVSLPKCVLSGIQSLFVAKYNNYNKLLNEAKK
jgi:hypothetical protein